MSGEFCASSYLLALEFNPPTLPSPRPRANLQVKLTPSYEASPMKSVPLYLAFVFSVLTALGLWLMESIPGKVGWTQTIALYPALLILGIGAYRGDSRIGLYALALCVLGGGAALVQLLTASSLPSFLGLSFPQVSLIGFVMMALVLMATLEGAKPARERNWGIVFAALVALIATGGSLYFSEVNKFLPCTLCWYQRVCMYSSALLLTLTVLRGDRWMALYALPLTLGGFTVALYHVLEERGIVQTLRVCSEGIPCNTPWINWLGFITIPALSLAAFVLMGISLALALPRAQGKTRKSSPAR